MNLKIKTQIKTIIESSNSKWNLLDTKETYLLAISGGKDSLALLTILSDYLDKTLCVHVSLDSSSDLSFISFVEQYSPIDVIKTSIMQEASNSPKNPCFICSRRRNQAIFEYAYSKGIRKVIFAHNRDDVSETLLMNMIYSRKISTMLPKQDLFAGKIQVIRPLYEVPEILLANYAKDFPAVKKSCIYDGHTKRQYIKNLIKQISSDHPHIKVEDNLYNSILNLDLKHLPNPILVKDL
jgi:tRNA 2-thiocytidine biosynthesis protein TtcA